MLDLNEDEHHSNHLIGARLSFKKGQLPSDLGGDAVSPRTERAALQLEEQLRSTKL